MSEFRADPHEFSADPGEFYADPREFSANSREFPADPCEFSADPREFSANPRVNNPQIRRYSYADLRSSLPFLHVNAPLCISLSAICVD